MPKRVMDPAFRRDLLHHEILRRMPPELVLFLKSPKEQKFLSDFLSESKLMEPFVGSGPLESPLYAVLSLAAIALDDPSAMKSDLERRIAIATALETAMAKRTPENAVKVYKYYRDRARTGSLHPGFSRLAVWEMRFAVGARFAAEDLEFIGNRSSFSAKDAVNACWQVQYLDVNPFGESVQSDKYYRPWISGGLSYSQCTIGVGGVCGSLSTTGAMTAMASGIPAVTMGETGHCAYAVRVRPGLWLDGNSIDGNSRAPHRHYFQENWSDLFAGDEAWLDPGLPKAQGLAWAAHALPPTDVAGRAALLDQAIAALPGHVGHWQERIELAKQFGASPEWWASKASALVAAFVKYPHVSWTLLDSMPLNKLPQAARVQIQRAWLSACGKSTAGGIDLFPVDRIIAEIYSQRGSANLKSLVTDVWELSETKSKLGAKLSKVCRELVEREMRQCAEKGDKAGWNKLAEAGASLVKENYPHKHDPFPGEMLSREGLLRLSSAYVSSIYQGNSPLTHPGVLNGKGGFFHTEDEHRPEAVIELGHPGTLSGLVLINRPDFLQRAVPLTVSVSLDGKTWVPVFKTDKAESVWRVDLGKTRPAATYVKIEGSYPDGRKDFLHLHGVFVYGRRAGR